MKKRILTSIIAFIAIAMGIWADDITFSPLQYEHYPTCRLHVADTFVLPPPMATL